MAPFNGINNPIRQIKVNRTAICAITLFSFLSPGEQNNKAHPKIKGIIAVPDVLSRYPYNPITIKDIEFNIFAFNEFIIIYLVIKVL